MFIGKIMLVLLLSVLLLVGVVWVVGNDILVYCLEVFLEFFNLQIVSFGLLFVVSLQVLYNCLVSFDLVKNMLILLLVIEWYVFEDGKIWIFILCQGVKFNSNKFFKLICDFNVDDVLFFVLCQMDFQYFYYKVLQGNYEYFYDVGFDKLIKLVKKVDDYYVQFEFNELNVVFFVDWGMDFVFILLVEYGEVMLKKGMLENVDNWFVGIGLYVLQQYKVDL